jgi:hypothetical protein
MYTLIVSLTYTYHCYTAALTLSLPQFTVVPVISGNMITDMSNLLILLQHSLSKNKVDLARCTTAMMTVPAHVSIDDVSEGLSAADIDALTLIVHDLGVSDQHYTAHLHCMLALLKQFARDFAMYITTTAAPFAVVSACVQQYCVAVHATNTLTLAVSTVTTPNR